MASLGQVVQNLSTGTLTVTWILVWAAIILLVIIFLSLAIWAVFFRIKWNLKVEIKLPRSDGKIINGEWGKGFYDTKKGAVFIKRPGRGSRKIPMKIFDVKKYLQGTNLLTVIQTGPEEYRPILNSSYSEIQVEVIDTTNPRKDDKGNPILNLETGQPIYHTKFIKESIMNIQTETGKNKAWKAAFEDAAANAYTMKSLFKQYQTPIAIGIVVICCFIGFAVLWTKLSSVCG